MKNKVEVTKQHKCIHHWIIDAPDAPTSYGKCKRCGEVAEFYNTYTSDFVNRAKLADEMPILAID